MARLLGRTWFAYVGESEPITIDLDRSAAVAVESTATELARHLEGQGLPVRRSKIVNYGPTAEGVVLQDKSSTEGALVSVRANDKNKQLLVEVGRSSAVLRSAIYVVIGATVIAGLIVAMTVLPSSWDAMLRLSLGLFMGIGAAVPLLVAVANISWFAGGESDAMRERLQELTRAYLDSTAERETA